MKNTLIVLLFLIIHTTLMAQQNSDSLKIERACMSYINAFYTGDTTLFINSVRPRLSKLGFWQEQDGTVTYKGEMNYSSALSFITEINKNKRYAEEDAVKIIELLDLGKNIALVKVTAWWGIDYITLSRMDEHWMIEQVLWEGPLTLNHNK